MRDMEIEVINEFDNLLLNRKEYKLKIRHPNSGPPSRVNLRKKFSSLIGMSENLVVVKKIMTRYGTNISTAVIYVYKSEDSLNVEPEYILRRNELIIKKEGEAKA